MCLPQNGGHVDQNLALITRNGYTTLLMSHLGIETYKVMKVISPGTRNGKTYTIMTPSEYIISNKHSKT